MSSPPGGGAVHVDSAADLPGIDAAQTPSRSNVDVRAGSVFRDIVRREVNFSPRPPVSASRQRKGVSGPHVGHPSFVRGLRLVQSLEKHAGCVNTVAWNEDASLLLSGSDDLCVCVWSTGTGFPCRGSVYTGHRHNIFSAEFVPGSGSAQCVTTAGDGDVRLVDLVRGFTDPIPENPRLFNPEDAPSARSLFSHDRFGWDYTMAGMGMKVRFVPGSQHVFLTTHQDGTVRRFDLRLPTADEPYMHRGIVDLARCGSCSDIAFDPTAPNLFAVGTDDPFVRIFDLRRVDTLGEGDWMSVVAKYYPGESSGFNNRSARFDGVSGLAYSRAGELAVTYRGEHLYVIDQRKHREDHGWGRGGSGSGNDESSGRASARRTSARVRIPGVGEDSSDSGETSEDDEYESEDSAVSPEPNAGGWDLFGEDPTLFNEPSVRQFIGHKNVKTFLKGVAFMCDDQYLTTGCDSGAMFIWHKDSCEMVCKVQADSQVVNNVLPHPNLPMVVTSGIDDVLRVWEAGEGLHRAEIPTQDTSSSMDFEERLNEMLLTFGRSENDDDDEDDSDDSDDGNDDDIEDDGDDEEGPGTSSGDANNDEGGESDKEVCDKTNTNKGSDRNSSENEDPGGGSGGSSVSSKREQAFRGSSSADAMPLDGDNVKNELDEEHREQKRYKAHSSSDQG